MADTEHSVLEEIYSKGYTVCAKKVTPFWYSRFLALLDALYLQIFVYLHIIFIKCLISEPSVVSTVQDGAPSHTAKNTINYLKRENVSFIEP